MLRALQTESEGTAIDPSVAADRPPATGLSWQQRLASITNSYDTPKIANFLDGTTRAASRRRASRGPRAKA